MSQTTGIDFRQLARDHDARPFSSTDKPTIVLLPAPEMGGFDVCNCYPSLEKTSTLARRLRRLPLLEAFYLNHARPDPQTMEDLDRNEFLGYPLSKVIDIIRQHRINEETNAKS
ncbi:hypothetical protein [Roseobacter phage RDJL3]|jgi:hypothetical protein|nr:hypothetical protein [Roseobacter phage RDJL3]